jgi:outer membrane protein
LTAREVFRPKTLLALILVLQLSPHLWAQAPRLEGPLSLQNSLEFALAHHPTLSVLQSESLAAQARVQEAQGAFWPKLAAGLYLNAGNTPMIVSAAPTVEPPFLTRLPGGAGSLNLSLMLPLYTGGRLQARLAQAQAEERAQLARTALAIQEVSRDTRRAYYEALQAQARLEASRWKLAQQEELLRLTIEKVRIGSLAGYIQRRIEAELAAATQEQNSAKAEQSNALVTLSLALGAAVDSDFQLSVPAQIEMPQETVQANLQQALQDRPDLVVARILVESSDQRLYQALSAYSPQLAAYAMAEGMRQPALGNGATEGGYQVGLVLSWPLFDRERDVIRAPTGQVLGAYATVPAVVGTPICSFAWP